MLQISVFIPRFEELNINLSFAHLLSILLHQIRTRKLEPQSYWSYSEYYVVTKRVVIHSIYMGLALLLSQVVNHTAHFFRIVYFTKHTFILNYSQIFWFYAKTTLMLETRSLKSSM